MTLSVRAETAMRHQRQIWPRVEFVSGPGANLDWDLCPGGALCHSIVPTLKFNNKSLQYFSRREPLESTLARSHCSRTARQFVVKARPDSPSVQANVSDRRVIYVAVLRHRHLVGLIALEMSPQWPQLGLFRLHHLDKSVDKMSERVLPQVELSGTRTFHCQSSVAGTID